MVLVLKWVFISVTCLGTGRLSRGLVWVDSRGLNVVSISLRSGWSTLSLFFETVKFFGHRGMEVSSGDMRVGGGWSLPGITLTLQTLLHLTSYTVFSSCFKSSFNFRLGFLGSIGHLVRFSSFYFVRKIPSWFDLKTLPF